MTLAALVLWAVFLGAAAFYTGQARHRDSRPLAAYLVFVTLFTVAAGVLFSTVVYLLLALGWTAALEQPLGAALCLVVVFVPAFLIARWQLRRPPSRVHRPL